MRSSESCRKQQLMFLLSYVQGRKGVPRRDRRRYVTKSPSPNPIALRHTRMQEEESHSHHNGSDSAREIRSVSHESSPESGFQKRKRPVGDGSMFQKRHKRPSVEAHTLSVKRLSVPVCEPSSEPTGHVQTPDHAFLPDAESNHAQPAETLAHVNEEKNVAKSRPRSLRVSLSLSEDMEVGSPHLKMQSTASASVSKVVGSPVMDSSSTSSEAHSLPSWDDIATSDPTKGSTLSATPSSKPFVVHISDVEKSAGKSGSCSTLTEVHATVQTERKRKLTDSDTCATTKLARKELLPQSTASYSPPSSSSDEMFDSSSSENKFVQRPAVPTNAATSVVPLKTVNQIPPGDHARNLTDQSKATGGSVVAIRDVAEPTTVKKGSAPQSKATEMTATPLPNHSAAATSSPMEVATKTHSSVAVNVSSDLSELPQKMQRPTTLKPQTSLSRSPRAAIVSTKVTAGAGSPQPGRVPIIQHTKQMVTTTSTAATLSPTAVALRKPNQQSASPVAMATMATACTVTSVAAASLPSCTKAEAVTPKPAVVSKAPSGSVAPTEDTDDVIMTGFEPQKHPAKSTSVRALSTAQAAPSGHLPKDAGVKKVSAKTVVSMSVCKNCTVHKISSCFGD